MHFRKELRSCSRKILACYLPLGDPLMPSDMADIYVACGVDILEVGFPDGNPVLDGSLVRNSMKRSLASGMTASQWRAQLSEVRHKLPYTYMVAMGYVDLSPLVASGDGELLADAVLQVGHASQPTSDTLQQVAFVSTRFEEQEILAARSATAYVMVQANEGRTGLRRSLPDENRVRIARLRKERVEVPILLGIGISTAAQTAKALGFGADGVIVGSACINAAIKGRYALSKFVRSVRDVLDA
ncbi:MAG: tryptophan synthase subunit alpha [Woeseia sp.]